MTSKSDQAAAGDMGRGNRGGLPFSTLKTEPMQRVFNHLPLRKRRPRTVWHEIAEGLALHLCLALAGLLLGAAIYALALLAFAL